MSERDRKIQGKRERERDGGGGGGGGGGGRRRWGETERREGSAIRTPPS